MPHTDAFGFQHDLLEQVARGSPAPDGVAGATTGFAVVDPDHGEQV
jgi:hypothetical protein